MRTIKKNQVMIGVIAILLMAAGYFNYSGTLKPNEAIETGKLMDAEELASIGDAKLVSSEGIEEENLNLQSTTDTTVSSLQENTITNTTKNTIETTKETGAQTSTDAYFSKSRLERDTMYSQSLSTYEKLLENTSISAEQKQIAQTEIKRIQEEKNAIMIAENLIKTKGFAEVIIFQNKESVNVIVKSEELTEEAIAQVQNIITRELGVEIENIHLAQK